MIYEDFEFQCIPRTIADGTVYIVGTASYSAIDVDWIIEVTDTDSQGLELSGSLEPQSAFDYVTVETEGAYTEYLALFPTGNESREALEAWLVSKGLIPAS